MKPVVSDQDGKHVPPSLNCSRRRKRDLRFCPCCRPDDYLMLHIARCWRGNDSMVRREKRKKKERANHG